MLDERPAITEITRKGFQRAGIDMLLHLAEGIDYIIDLETTGLDVLKDEAIQISVLQFSTTRILCNEHFLPSVPISKGAFRVHGKDENWLLENKAVKFEDAYKGIAISLQGKVLAGYNVAFDACILDNMCTRRGLEPFKVGVWIDLMPAMTLIHGRWSSYRKGFAWPKLSEFNIKKRDMHDAVSDCLVLCDYVHHIQKKVGKYSDD